MSIAIDLTGRRALVVGGAGGIGAALLASLRAAGARTACLDVRPPGDELADVVVEADVAEAGESGRAVGLAAAALVGLDHVAYCAGVARDAALWKLTDEQWREVLDVNLTGAFHVLRAAAPHLRAPRAGAGASVVLVASINGERGKRGQANYSASKGGLIALGRAAARELGASGAHVNVVSPGWIDTAMTRGLPDELREAARAETALGRTGRPEDVAGAALFLLSDLAGHVTGQVLRVDGGQLIS